MDWKRVIPDLAAVVLFVVIAFAYFFPSDIEGRVLAGHDNIATIGAGQEAKEYHERTGETTRWTNGLFGGMPTYQISPSYDSTAPLSIAGKIYQLFLPNYVGLMFIMLLGFYIMLRAFGISVWLSTLGALGWALSSYFPILVYAGHIWKYLTLAYIPPTIGGIVLAYRGRYLAGGVLTALFFALQLLSNHVQMTYYSMFVILALVIAFGIDAWRHGTLRSFGKATGILAIAAAIGVLINLSNIYHTYEYSKETMRGKSELVKADNENQTDGGLERDYITQWSYGRDETLTLLVPNLKGGSSEHRMSDSDVAMDKANPNLQPLYQQLGQYWGEQPGTSGPVYVGALILTLAILALFIVKGPVKWALLIVTLLSIFLSWGKNMMWFTDLFIDYMPMYAKFRAVSSILVIAEFTIPLLAVLGLKELFDGNGAPTTDKAAHSTAQPRLSGDAKSGLRHRKFVFISFGITGIVALLIAFAPGALFGSFVSSYEMQAMSQFPQETLSLVVGNLTEMRKAMVASDALRSALIIAAGFVVIMLAMHGKVKKVTAIALVALICLVDLWGIDKRYLNDTHFVPKSETELVYRPTEADKYILQDKSPDYRVLNLAVSTFNDNTTSYYHKSIGGYHAAKLRRYQEMIEHHITADMSAISRALYENNGDLTAVDGRQFQVLNMLNTKYVIVPTQNGGTMALPNPYCMGNAWFVNTVRYADNANQEIEMVSETDLRNTAVADRRFEKVLDFEAADSAGAKMNIALSSYEPNMLVYETDNEADGVAVFSEIYYPDWTATIDGQPAEIARVNYILRAMKIPAGRHTVTFTFDPMSIKRTEATAYSALAILVLGAAWLIARSIMSRKAKPKADGE